MKLKILRIMAIITGLIGTTLFNRFIEGGALFMSLVLIYLLSSIYFSVKSFLNLRTNIEISKKMLNNISNSGTLGLALGVMGAFIGLITAFDVLEEFGIKPVCIILDDPPSSLFPSYFSKAISSLGSLTGSVLGESVNDFRNHQKDTPVLVYCTEENESSFEQLATKSDLTVRAVLSGNGSQKILNSKSIRMEMNEFISMSMTPLISTQSESPQE